MELIVGGMSGRSISLEVYTADGNRKTVLDIARQYVQRPRAFLDPLTRQERDC